MCLQYDSPIILFSWRCQIRFRILLESELSPMWRKSHFHRLFPIKDLAIFTVLNFIQSLLIYYWLDLYRFILRNMIDFGYLEIALTPNLKVHATLLLGSELGILHKQCHISHSILIAYRRLTVIKSVRIVKRLFISIG
jgi:hypothetical protein